VSVGTAAEASLPHGVAAASDDPNALPVDPLGSLSPGASAHPGAPAPGSSAPGSSPTPAASGRPPTAGGPVPADLQPSLATVKDDAAIIYAHGCPLAQPTVEPKVCLFGDTSSPTPVVLIGDSHAAQWFPPLARLATVEHWQLVSLTKSACTPADVT